jgi:antitoxin (DNA-binding transcriptional repressor) of toxin-antitoxin stability system
MQVSVSEAKGNSEDLVRRAEAGDEVVTTQDDRATGPLVPVKTTLPGRPRRALLEAARASGSSKAKSGPSAARSQDFLYEDDRLEPGY